MVVMVLEKVSTSARGELTRWLLEVRNGVFVGHITARVRDKLWEKCIKNNPTGGVFQAWSSNNEQHFQMRISGDTSRRIVYEEGLQLIKIPGEQVKFAKRRAKQTKKEQKSDILNEIT
jgi:CRISPR-associated protein Cas2